MRFLLDTHFVIEVIDEVRYGLSEPGILEQAQQEGDFVVSAVSLWEAEIKSRIGKLSLRRGIHHWPHLLAVAGIELLPLTAEQILADIGFELENKDPFDRVLLSVAKAEGCRLLTGDQVLLRHPLAWRPFLP